MKKLLEWMDEERGRRAKLACALAITPSALSQWNIVPIGHVASIAEMTGISREELRPDIFSIQEPAE